MSKKTDIQAELTRLGIEFDPAASTQVLESLLPAGDPIRNDPEDEENDDFIVVQDAELFRPKELPLLITIPGGAKNPEQQKYLNVLNVAAYANQNWKKVKDTEIKRLKEIGTNPEMYYVYSGESREANGRIEFGNSEMLSKKPV